MDIHKFFNELNKKIDNMSDKEFMEALNKAGLKDCPNKDDKMTNKCVKKFTLEKIIEARKKKG